MAKEKEKIGMTIRDDTGREAKFDSIEEFQKAGEKLIDNLKANKGVIGESPDYSDYAEYWTIPKRVIAKRLTEPKSIRVVKNGVEGWLNGEAGHIHVVDNSGDAPKEMLHSQEDFEKKFSDKLQIQPSLFADKEA